MPDLAYKRVLLKLSGEALLGGREYGIDPKTVQSPPVYLAASALVLGRQSLALQGASVPGDDPFKRNRPLRKYIALGACYVYICENDKPGTQEPRPGPRLARPVPRAVPNGLGFTPSGVPPVCVRSRSGAPSVRPDGAAQGRSYRFHCRKPASRGLPGRHFPRLHGPAQAGLISLPSFPIGFTRSATPGRGSPPPPVGTAPNRPAG